MSDNPHYTARQMEYINSVGGKAHITAVEIIGELETNLKDFERLKELLTNCEYLPWPLRGQLHEIFTGEPYTFKENEGNNG